MSTLTLIYGCAWTLTSPHWQSHWNHIVTTRSVGTPQGWAQQWPLWVFNWWRWQSNMAMWMQPVAYSYTDVDFDSDVWVCLEVDITTLAKSQKSYCKDLFHWHTQRPCSTMAIMSTQLMTVMIRGGVVDAVSSLFIHWCGLWLWYGCAWTLTSPHWRSH